MRLYIIICWFFGIGYTLAQSPVRVGVWEVFDKYSLPPKNVSVNSREYKNGRDDDGDGYIDNINGIGFDAQEQLAPEYFYCNTATAPRYNHGTAVASVLLAHNPEVELYGVGFIPTSQRIQETGIGSMSVPERQANLPTEYARMKRFIDTSLAYFARQQCRVVNISWGLSLQSFMAGNTNLGHTMRERRQKATEWLTHFEGYLTEGFRRYPATVFVVAVGNEGRNSQQAMDIPGRIVLDNVVLVGALDGSEQKRASYSNYGNGVVYAPGTDIRTRIALNQVTTASGTSLAAPVVTALIARLMQETNAPANTIAQTLLKQRLATGQWYVQNGLPGNEPVQRIFD